MSHKIYLGIDNGTTGTIGVTGEGWIPVMIETPVVKEQSYTKAKNEITRIDHRSLRLWLMENVLRKQGFIPSDILAVIERPMINPMRFKASISAARSLESTLCVLEDFGIPLMYVDSRQWQSVMLPQGCEGKELKKASKDIGCRLFPHLKEIIGKHKDADGLLISEWARRERL